MKKYLVLLYLSAIILNIKAQSNYVETLFSTKQGLSQTDIHDIFQDKNNFIWMTSNDGLNKFDGYKFKHYYYGHNGLEGNQLNNSCKQGDKNFFIGTNNGIHLYEAEKDLFIPLYKLYDKNKKLLKDVSEAYNYDENNNLWTFQKSNIKLLKIKFQKDKIANIKDYSIFLKGDIIRDIKTIDQQIILAGNRGLYLYMKDLDKIVSILNKTNCGNLFPFSKNELFFTSSGALYYFNLYKHDLSLLKKGKDIKFFYKAPYIYINCNKSLTKYRYITSSNKLKFEETLNKKENSTLSSLFVDKNNSIWTGYAKEGVFKYNKKKHLFNTENCGSNHISCIFQDFNNNLFLGTEGTGLFIKKNNQNIIKKFGNNKIYAISYSPTDKNYYISLAGMGLIHSKNINFDNYITIPHSSNSRTFLFDKNYIWITTYGRGLLRYNRKTKKTDDFNLENGLTSLIVRNIILDKYENIWLGTSKGLCFLEAKEKEKSIPKFKKIPETKRDYIIPMLYDNKNRLWYGTLGNGLHCVETSQQGEISSKLILTTSNGLKNNAIKSLEQDKYNKIWFSSNKGIHSLNLENNTIKNYNTIDGLNCDEFMELSSTTINNGNLIFGGINGYSTINPYETVYNNEQERPVITDFLISNHSIINDSTKSNILYPQNINFTKKIELKYNQNSFSFIFSSLEYKKPSKINFKYILEGYDKKWITTDAEKRIANYTKLKSGTYNFKIVSSNTNGIWSDKVREIKITIHKPYWKTKTALYIYLVIIISIIYLISYQIKSRKSIKEEKIKLLNTIENLEQEKLSLVESFLEPRKEEFNNSDKKFIENIKELLEANIGNADYNVTDLEKELGLTKYLLNKKTKEIFNKTPLQLIHSIKMKRAAQLLSTGKYSVSETTFEVGFNDIRQFRKYFKEEFGTLPKEYKGKNKE